ncbi:MAG: AbrB family transcriptional regulator, partial [Burkholderiaceae bacterium]
SSTFGSIMISPFAHIVHHFAVVLLQLHHKNKFDCVKSRGKIRSINNTEKEMKFATDLFHATIFAAVIGGASDMAHQAAQAGGRGDLVALAHTIRVSLVVGITPFLALWFSNSGDAVTGSPGLESNGFVCP